MLAKKFRLPVGAFPLKARTLYRGQHLTVKVSVNNVPYNRIGVIVTKKTASRAVERNRLRRKVFDLFREVVGKPAFAEATAGKDLLVLVKPIKLDRDNEGRLFQELNLVKQKLIE